MKKSSETAKLFPGNPRIVIAAGGTGGHFFPALAVGEACRTRGAKVIFAIGGQHADEHICLAESKGFETLRVLTPRLPKYPWQALSFALNFGFARRKTSRFLREFAPSAVLGMGSFAAAPVCAAALTRQTPLVLHEANTILGTANHFFSHRATAIAFFLPLQNAAPRLKPKIHAIGMPLRPELIEAAITLPGAKAAAKTHYGLLPDRATLLVFGGSQGARYLNQLMLDVVPRLEDQATQRMQAIHLTGDQGAVAGLQAVYESHGIKAKVMVREEAMQYCYQAADLVLCRAGAATIAELAIFGKPAILAPLPTAAKNHQAVNANVVADHNGGLVLAQTPDAADTCAMHLESWLKDMRPWKERGQAIRRFAYPDAANNMAELLERTAKF